MTTVAGQGPGDEAGDGGPAAQADVNLPYGASYSQPDGALLIADTHNDSIRVMSDTTDPVTSAYNGSMATFNGGVPEPDQIAASPTGAIYIESGHAIDRVSPGQPGYTTIYSHLRGEPGGLVVDGNGDVYAGDGARLLRIDGTTGAATILSKGKYPVTALALDGNGDLFVAVYDTLYERYRIDERFPDNSVTTDFVGIDKITGLVSGTGQPPLFGGARACTTPWASTT